MSQEDFANVEQEEDETEKENPDHSGETLCETCEHKAECEHRQDEEPHIFESQWLHCHEVLGRQDYHDDDKWINDFIVEGKS